nr:TIGR01777 family oxidoreductase [Bacteroidia bacterium]
GMVGRALTSELLKKGHSVGWLVRNKMTEEHVTIYRWQPEKNQIDLRAFENTDHLVNLNGSNIAGKSWTKENKQEIYDSRIKSTEFLLETIRKNKIKLQSICGASATGYYGNETAEAWCDENTPAGKDYLANVCCDWEKTYSNTAEITSRLVILRIGIVLGQQGGMYARLLPLFKAGLAAVIGNGRNYISWVHLQDLVRMFVHAIEKNTVQGIYNATASKPATLSDFTHLMAKSLNRKVWLPNVPAFVLQILMGERASLIVKGCRVKNDKIKSTLFEFNYPDLNSALMALADQKIQRTS